MTVEDYLEILAGISPLAKHDFVILDQDSKLIHSLSQQTRKKIALTDRQHELIKKKLLQYSDQFTQHGYSNLFLNLNITRQPYRIIDRSKTITLVSQSYYEDFFHTATNTLMMAIRFPFSKKMIKHIELIKSLQGGATGYDSKTKTHFVRFNEYTVFKIIDKLKDCNFEIDKVIINFYEKIKNYQDKYVEYKPGIFNYELKNTSKTVKDFAYSTYGSPTKNNLILYYDRKDLLGLQHFDQNELNCSFNQYDWLTKQIANRNNRHVYIKNTNVILQQILAALHNLQRYPILFVLSKHQKYNKDINEPCIEQLYNIENAKDKQIDLQSTVLFRLENTTPENMKWNSYIKDKNLNLPIDKNKTKIAYINSAKLPKPLLRSNWKPNAIVILDSCRLPKNINLYTNQNDLVIYYSDILPYYNHTPIDII